MHLKDLWYEKSARFATSVYAISFHYLHTSKNYQFWWFFFHHLQKATLINWRCVHLLMTTSFSLSQPTCLKKFWIGYSSTGCRELWYSLVDGGRRNGRVELSEAVVSMGSFLNSSRTSLVPTDISQQREALHRGWGAARSAAPQPRLWPAISGWLRW